MLRDEHTDAPIAIEVSSTWRSKDAGREDFEWSRWTEQVGALIRGKIPGQFRISTPLRIPRDVSPAAFAGALEEFLRREAANIEALDREGKYLGTHVQGLYVHVAHATQSGSDLTFGRQLPDEELRDFPDRVREILEAKSPKLKHNKDAGRETWLVIYNTFWPVLSPYDVQQIFLRWLGSDHKHVDHIGVVSGNPPSDAGMDIIR